MFWDDFDKNKKFGTDYNFKPSSFVDGIGSCFNVPGNYYPSNLHSDSMSIRNDWATIGNDFNNTINSNPFPNNPFKNEF